MTHGTIGGYTNHKCRCAACRAAWAAYCKLKAEERKAAGLCRQCDHKAMPGRVHCLNHAVRASELIKAHRASHQ